MSLFRKLQGTRELGKRKTVWTPGKIRAMRITLGETQEKFAGRVGVTWSTISRWERGTSIPSPVFEDILEGMRRTLALQGIAVPSTAPKGLAGRPKKTVDIDVERHRMEVELEEEEMEEML